MAVEIPRWRFTVDEYYRMAEAGIFSERDRVELIEGEVVRMSPIGSRHASAVRRVDFLFGSRLAGRAIVSVQNPVRLSDTSEPEPDVALLLPRPDFYSESHPGPTDVLLIIEVADTTVQYDRRVKANLYARAGVPEYWLMDLPGDAIERHSEPSADGYRIVQRFHRGERIGVQALPDVELLVDDLLGPVEQRDEDGAGEGVTNGADGAGGDR